MNFYEWFIFCPGTELGNREGGVDSGGYSGRWGKVGTGFPVGNRNLDCPLGKNPSSCFRGRTQISLCGTDDVFPFLRFFAVFIPRILIGIGTLNITVIVVM